MNNSVSTEFEVSRFLFVRLRAFSPVSEYLSSPRSDNNGTTVGPTASRRKPSALAFLQITLIPSERIGFLRRSDKLCNVVFKCVMYFIKVKIPMAWT